MYSRARLENFITLSCVITSSDRHRLTLPIKFSFLFLFGNWKFAITVLCTAPGVLNTLACLFWMAFRCAINQDSHFRSHRLQHRLLLFKVGAVTKKILKARVEIKDSKGIFSSIDGVVVFWICYIWVNETSLPCYLQKSLWFSKPAFFHSFHLFMDWYTSCLCCLLHLFFSSRR